MRFSWNDIFYLFIFLSYQLLAPVPRKKNKFISFRERPLDNHTQFQTKMFKIYTRFQTKTIPFGAAHTYIPHIGDYPPGLEKRGAKTSTSTIGSTAAVVKVAIADGIAEVHFLHKPSV